jgi:hypothetical protein
VQQALQRHAAAYLAAHRPDAVRRAVLGRLLACRTAALGGHLSECESCGWSHPRYNSCCDRHCAQCQGGARAKWLDQQELRMLPVPHFQVVFTLPSELRAVALRNDALVYGAMFDASAEVLHELALERFDAVLGFTTVLHTWSSDLRHHPHVHALVTGGGLGEQGWTASRSAFLFPHRQLAARYKVRLVARLRAAFAAGELSAPDGDLAQLRRVLRDVGRRRVRFVVHVEPPAGRGATVAARYLARYARGIALADARVVAVTDADVAIRVGDRVVTLPGVEFVRRFLQHVLPPGFRRIRHYGLYAPGPAGRRREAAAALLGVAQPPKGDEPPDDGLLPSPATLAEPRCPRCGRPTRRHTLPPTRPWIRWAPLPRRPP